MVTLEEIKIKIKKLYESNPNITVNVNMSHPRISLQAAPAVISAVYPNVFQLQEVGAPYAKKHLIKYTDVLIRQIEILELNFN